MTRPRKQDDGTLIYPNRGEPPPVPSNDYSRDPGNPYVFIPILPACTFRTQGWEDCACLGGKRFFYACAKNHKVSLDECKACKAERRYEKTPVT